MDARAALLVVAPVNTGPNRAVPGALQLLSVMRIVRKINFLNIKDIQAST